MPWVPIFKKSFGFSNSEEQELLTNNSVYKLNSITKQFTAMGIIILKNQSKINLEDKLSEYIPELDFYKNVTIKNDWSEFWKHTRTTKHDDWKMFEILCVWVIIEISV